MEYTMYVKALDNTYTVLLNTSRGPTVYTLKCALAKLIYFFGDTDTYDIPPSKLQQFQIAPRNK